MMCKRILGLLSLHRIFVLLAFIVLAMSLFSPRFLSSQNLAAILKGMSLDAIAAVGFTIVLITGKLDLSIGTTLTLAGMITIGAQSSLGVWLSVLLALGAGALVGAWNGFLVCKARVDSFIATLGTMIVTQGLVFRLCHGGTLTSQDFGPGRWLDGPLLSLLSPRVLIALALVIGFEVFLKKTRLGRNFFLVGGRASTAWHAGISVDRTVVTGYVLSGILSALAGALMSLSVSSAMPTQGNSSLMRIIAAVIMGGTSMSGGRGSVIHSMVALLALSALFCGFSGMGAGWEVQKIAAGVVLSSVILYDAWLILKRSRVRGQRRELAEEARLRQASISEGRSELDRRDLVPLSIVCASVVACVAIVAIFAMYFLTLRAPQPAAASPLGTALGRAATGRQAPEPEKPAEIDQEVAGLTSADGQPLIFPPEPKTVPPRPQDPQSLPEEDAFHWYDMEYAGWNVPKVNPPQSPGDGPKGKRVTYLKFVDHPYLTAMSRGMKKIAEAYGIQLKTMVANNDINIQTQQIDQTINERPDLVIINPVDAKACVVGLRKLNEAGIPTIASNLLPVSEGMKYVLAWTGPDDWGQFRELARDFAERMNYEGGYCIIRHFPGGSPYFSRTFAAITELKKIAPKMKLLDMQPTELDAEKTLQVMSDWLTRFGPELKGIVSADDSGAMIGIHEAIKNAHREDIITVAAGNSKVGMDFVKDGALSAITFQSPEADGALPMALAAQWFSGKEIPAIRYLPIRLITKDTVDQYLPAQW